MKIYKHDYLAKKEVIPPKFIFEIETALEKYEPLKPFSTTRVRHDIKELLINFGWSGMVRLSQGSSISITSQREQTGLCLQMGNVSRVYADLIKLQTLFAEKIITGAIFIIPTKREAKKIGSNIASFERLADELRIFSKTISIPLKILGFSRQ